MLPLLLMRFINVRYETSMALVTVHETCDYYLESHATTEVLDSLDCLPRGKTRGSLRLGFCCTSFRCS